MFFFLPLFQKWTCGHEKRQAETVSIILLQHDPAFPRLVGRRTLLCWALHPDQPKVNNFSRYKSCRFFFFFFRKPEPLRWKSWPPLPPLKASNFHNSSCFHSMMSPWFFQPFLLTKFFSGQKVAVHQFLHNSDASIRLCEMAATLLLEQTFTLSSSSLLSLLLF